MAEGRVDILPDRFRGWDWTGTDFPDRESGKVQAALVLKTASMDAEIIYSSRVYVDRIFYFDSVAEEIEACTYPFAGFQAGCG